MSQGNSSIYMPEHVCRGQKQLHSECRTNLGHMGVFKKRNIILNINIILKIAWCFAWVNDHSKEPCKINSLGILGRFKKFHFLLFWTDLNLLFSCLSLLIAGITDVYTTFGSELLQYYSLRKERCLRGLGNSLPVDASLSCFRK